jgi:hypothetical protein
VATRDQWDFALDAVLGTGARGEPEGLAAAAVQALRELDERGTRVVAVDLPTGMNADSGAIARRTVRADLTVTFGAPKRGHYLSRPRVHRRARAVDISLWPRWRSAFPFPSPSLIAARCRSATARARARSAACSSPARPADRRGDAGRAGRDRPSAGWCSARPRASTTF